jgi:hypothetical protein
MAVKLFIPQQVIDGWLSADLVDLSGEILKLRAGGLALRLVQGYYFSKVQAGTDDANRLLGKVKAKAAVAALGAEVYLSSVLLGDTAYQVEPGFVAKAVGSDSSDQTVLAALAAMQM